MAAAEEVNLQQEREEDEEEEEDEKEEEEEWQNTLGMNWTAWKSECTWRKLWTERSWSDIIGHFVKVLLFALLPSLLDVVTDAFNASNFISGTDYMKRVTNISHPENENCTPIGYYNKFTSDGESVTEYYEVSCHEEDPIWGYLTLSLIFLPGLQASIRLNGKGRYSCLLLIFATFLFPVMMVAVKVFSLFNPGSEMEKLTDQMTGMEGSFESTFQFLLTLFIILSRGDRSPSNAQLASLLASLVMLLKFQIQEFLKTKQSDKPPFVEKVQKATILLPLFLTNVIFKLGSIAVTAAVLRYWALLTLPVMYIIAVGVGSFAGKRGMSQGCVLHSVILQVLSRHNAGENWTAQAGIDNFLCNNIAWFCIHPAMLTIFVVIATIENNVKGVEIFSQNPAYARNILVHNLSHLWALYAVIMLSGIASAVLIYFQIWRPHNEAETNRRKVTNGEIYENYEMI